MLERAAVTAADRPNPVDPSEYVVWEHRFRPFRIRLKRGIDSALQAHALATEKSQNSAEVGGLLFGRIETNGPDVCITIAKAVFVGSKNRFFNSTASDRAALLEALRNNPDPESKAIGYFRSDLRDQFSLTSEDRQFIIGNLPIPHSVSLLIRPLQTGVCMLGVFLWKNNRIQNEFADFDVPQFGPEAPQAAPPVANTTPEAVSVSLRRDLPPAPTAKSSFMASGIVRGLVAATVCLSLLLIGSLIFILRRPTVQRPVPAVQTSAAPATTLVVESARQSDGARGLGLDVSRPAPDQLNVTWDRQLPPNARRGVLDIVDGSKRRSLALDEEQLRLGKLTYFSSGADLSFRLEVLLPKGRSISEYIRVLGTETYPNAVSRPQHATSIADVVGARPSGSDRTAPAVKATAIAQPPPPFAPAAIPETSSAVPNLQPELATTLPVPQPPPAIAAQPQPESPATKVPAPSAPIPQKTDAPVGPPAIASSFNPPQPAQRVMPKIHDIFPNGLPTARRVPVDVTVSPAGRVIKASTPERFGLLSDACVTAAKQWRFVPGTRNNQPVASQYQIVFVFDGRK